MVLQEEDLLTHRDGMLLPLLVLLLLDYPCLYVLRRANNVDTLWGVDRCNDDFGDPVLIALETFVKIHLSSYLILILFLVNHMTELAASLRILRYNMLK
jgi:hypothetical protein